MKLKVNWKNRKLLWSVAPAALALLLAGLFFGSELDGWIPSAAKLEAAADELARAEKTHRAIQAQLDQALELEKLWQSRRESCFLPSRDGDPELELRRKIEPAATKTELSLNTIGAVRQSAVNQNLNFAEIDLSGSGSIEQIAGFLRQLQEVKPLLFWKRLELRPEFRRGPAGSAEGLLQLSGTIRVFVINQSEVKK